MKVDQFILKRINWFAFLALFLFSTGYWICSWVYPGAMTVPPDPEQLSLWWDMRLAIYSVLFALFGITCWAVTSGFTRAIFLMFVLFCVGDIADRYLFNSNSFNLNDLLLFVVTVIYLISERGKK